MKKIASTIIMTVAAGLLGFALYKYFPLVPKRVTYPTPESIPKDRNLIISDDLKEVKTLDQNWSSEVAAKFYNIPQGSKLFPLDWFVNLEQPESQLLFLESNNILEYGYLPRKKSDDNQYGLPIGFTEDGKHLGMTCAACHTGQLNYNEVAYLIDGAPTMADSTAFLRDLEEAVKQTLKEDDKFQRLKTRLKSRDIDRAEFGKAYEKLAGYVKRNFPSQESPQFGPGRIDAFGAIMNEVAVTFANRPAANTNVNAPVSYPFLWDTPHHTFVQWHGEVENFKLGSPFKEIVGTEHVGALARNLGEVLGVFGEVDTSVDGQYKSSIHLAYLVDIEENLVRSLWSPKWPDGFPFDSDAADKGEVLYKDYCVKCHSLINRKDEGRQIIPLKKNVGTDPTMVLNVITRTSSSGVLEGRWVFVDDKLRKLKPDEKIGVLLAHIGQRVLFGKGEINEDQKMLLAARYSETGLSSEFEGQAIAYASDGIELGREDIEFKNFLLSEDGEELYAQIEPGTNIDTGNLKWNMDSHDLIDAPKARWKNVGKLKISLPGSYKARPLNGVWATGPFLHNGSVRTLDELLQPSNLRKAFRIGSLEFDPEKVGFVDDGDFLFDPDAQRGNSNRGHDKYENNLGEAKVFSKTERRQIIEYIKTLGGP